MTTAKKILSIILSAVMLLSCFSSPAASAADYNHLPQVYVEGLESKYIYYKDDTAQENPLFFPININMMVKNLLNYEKLINQAIAQGDPNLLKNYLCAWMQDCYGMIALKNDGYTMSDEVMVNETELNYEGDGKYVFKYDSRLDPVDIACELDEYIKWVQEDSGSKKFELAGSSYGASVVLTYLHEYPESRKEIDSVVLCVPSSNGVCFAGELFTGTFNLDPDTIEAFVSELVDSKELSLLLSALNKTGALDAILDKGLEPVLRVALLDALKEVLHDIFATFPGMWSFVDDRYFYDALENLYGEDYADPNHEYAGLISRITYYHEEIMTHTYEIVESVVEDGIKFNIICKYGNAAAPLSKEGNFMSDGLVALKDGSFGATSGMHKEKLPEGYKQALYPEYNFISPDGCVDASTAMLPFNTWFVRGLDHGEKNDRYFDLINTVLYDDLTVFDNAQFPQYLIVPEYDGNELVPTTADDHLAPEKKTSWLQDFIEFVLNIIPRLIELIKGLFTKEA